MIKGSHALVQDVLFLTLYKIHHTLSKQQTFQKAQVVHGTVVDIYWLANVS